MALKGINTVSWRGFHINGKFKDLSHLSTFTMYVDVDGKPIELEVSFLNHCFSDEKGGVRLPFKYEERYWSEDRYQSSFQLRGLIEAKFMSSYAIPYLNKKQNEQYHYMESYDYAIFFDINKPKGSVDKLKLKIVSAYELDPWGSDTVPTGKAKKVSWILSRRLNNQSAF